MILAEGGTSSLGRRMDRADEIEQVTDRLYAAATAPQEWPAALAGMVDLIGGDQATLLAPDNGGLRAASTFVNIVPSVIAGYHSPEGKQLWQPVFALVPVGAPVLGTAVISERDFERTAFYNEFVRPTGGWYSVGVRQERGSSFSLAVCRGRRAGDFDIADARVLQTLVPHIARVLDLRRRLHAAEDRATELTQLIDRLETGVILTDSAARPVLANTRAQKIAAEHDGLALDDDGLAGATATATRRLRDAVAAAGRGLVVDSVQVRLERPSQRLPLLLTVLPIWRLGTGVPGTAAPRVAIFIAEPDKPAAIDALALVETFRLTRRECEIAVLLADGLDLAAIASRLGLGMATVRDHLNHVFGKTGMRSQPALVSLLRGFVDPLN
jgi:DNA-binding CsgD family transcriptional regulator